MPRDISKPNYILTGPELHDALDRIMGRINLPKDSDLARLLAAHPTATLHRQPYGTGYIVTYYDENERRHGFVGLRTTTFDKDGKLCDMVATKSATFKSRQRQLKTNTILPHDKERD